MENGLNMTTNEVEKYMREQVRMNEFYTFSFTREYIEVVGEVCGVTSTYRIHPDGRLECRGRQKHKYGLFLGRFQPFHDGHGSIVMDAWNDCDNLIIGIGSAQEGRTKKNPLTYAERGGIIWALTCFNPNIKIIPIYDRDEYADNASWGTYVLDQVEKIVGVRPTVVFEGTEETHEHWWDDTGVEVVKIDRNETPISATQIRQMLLDDDKEGFTNNMPAGTWGFYDELREIMLEVYQNEEIQN